MSSEYSIISIGWPETYSGGLSPRSSAELLSPKPFNETGDGLPPPYFQIRASVTTTDEEIWFSSARAGGDPLKRLVGCWILATLPSDGIDEAISALGDIFEFHYARSAMIAPPVTRTLRTRGKVVRTSIRPPLELEA